MHISIFIFQILFLFIRKHYFFNISSILCCIKERRRKRKRRERYFIDCIIEKE